MQPNRVDLTKILKVGDKVWSVVRGEGKVIWISDKEEYEYKIRVEFKQSIEQFLSDGRWYRSHTFHELYPSSALEPWPEPCEFEKGELVIVSDYENKCFRIGHFMEKKDNIFIIKEDQYRHPYNFCWKFSDCPLPPKIDVK